MMPARLSVSPTTLCIVGGLAAGVIAFVVAIGPAWREGAVLRVIALMGGGILIGVLFSLLFKSHRVGGLGLIVAALLIPSGFAFVFNVEVCHLGETYYFKLHFLHSKA
jgi:phosphoglycerol transferase MdoB-like AlkP superfamily enzyme